MTKRIYLTAKKDTADLIRKACVERYLYEHPEMKHMNITDDKILYEIAKFYVQ